MVDIAKIKKALETEEYTCLYDLATSRTEDVKNVSKAKRVSSSDKDTGAGVSEKISPEAKLLAHDIVSIIDSTYKKRGQRLEMSMPKLAGAKNELLKKEFIIEVNLGKSMFLAPTVKLYEYMELTPAYKRNVSTEHSFLILLAKTFIQNNPLVQKTAVEVAINHTGKTIDLVAYMTDGQRHAYEITLSSSNVTENAAKMIGKGFSKVIFLCRDDQLRRSVSTILKDADFEPDFAATIDTEIFSSLMRKTRKFN